MGFRVMFKAESVADALSLILERFPALPKVIFYDVACKIDRNGMQRVRSILSHHGVRFCLDRAHAKGHTCSCIYNPDEALAVTNCVSTQAAEVQHSMSVKFRGHLTYMSPASFVAHRIAQLALMNLTAAFKLTDAAAKAENDGVRLNSFYCNVRGVRCVRSECACTASVRHGAEPDRSVGDGGIEPRGNVNSVDRGEGESLAGGAESVIGGGVELSEGGKSTAGGDGGSSVRGSDSMTDGEGGSSIEGADVLDRGEGDLSVEKGATSSGCGEGESSAREAAPRPAGDEVTD